MDETFRIGRVAGVSVGCHWSLLVIFWLVVWALATRGFPAAHPGYSSVAYWVAGILTAAVFLLSLLAHEVAHALVAHRFGMRVKGVTLWLFGGGERLGERSATPRIELLVGLAGPLVSVTAAVGYGLAAVMFDSLGAAGLVVGVLLWLARINLVLALLHLVPVHPLDGGRVLRAVLWAVQGDRVRATSTAARAGRALGYLLIGVGLAEVAGVSMVRGLWLVVLGWFILSAARAEAAVVLERHALGGLLVRDVMSPGPVAAPATISVEEVLEQFAMRHGFSTFPLVDDSGAPVGLITLSRLKTVPLGQRHLARALDLACPLGEVPQTRPDEPVVDLLDRLAGSADRRALVLDGGALVGIVSPTDVLRIVDVGALRRSPG
jgi:Zn-dependent protease/predicted transcriptional regulator